MLDHRGASHLVQHVPGVQDARGWVTAPGRRRVYVGGDERASALSATVLVPH
jgi:hypothetical protein